MEHKKLPHAQQCRQHNANLVRAKDDGILVTTIQINVQANDKDQGPRVPLAAGGWQLAMLHKIP